MSDRDEEAEEQEDVTATVPDMPSALAGSKKRDDDTEILGGAEEAPEDDEEEETDSEDEDSTDGDEYDDDDDDDDDADEEEDAADDDEDDEEDDDDDDDDDDDEEEDDDDEAEEDDDEGEIRFRYYGLTDVGLVREHNEDNFVIVDLAGNGPVQSGTDEEEHETYEGVLEDGLVLAVCDGMGGAAAGEVASQMAVDTIHEVMKKGETPSERDSFAHRLVYSIEEAGSRIFSAAKMDRSRRGMGTTSTVAGLIDNVLFVGQVGDSRCYVLRNGELSLITKDQSLVNQLIEAGQLTEEEAEAFEHSNIILQALGTTEDVSVDLTFVELRQGDRVMLCSDGLSGLVHTEMIKEVLAEGDDLPTIAARLVEMANAGGGHDNITCVVCDFDGEGLSESEGSATPVYSQYPLPPADHISDELPAREPTMKTGVRKPGADVKRDPMQLEADDPEVPTSGFPWWMVAVIFLVIAVVAIVFGMESGPEGEVDPNGTEPQQIAPPDEVEEVDVRVRTDVEDGELWVDNQSYGRLNGLDVHLSLLPGAYRFEARVGESVVASATLTVREGVPADVDLSLPRVVEPPPDEGLEGEGVEGEGLEGEGLEGETAEGLEGEGLEGEAAEGLEGEPPEEESPEPPTEMTEPARVDPRVTPMTTVMRTTMTTTMRRTTMRETEMAPPPNPF